MPDIPIERFSTFFGNTSEDVYQHLFRFKITCDFFNFTEDNVTCQLFSQTLHGNAHEWFYSLLPGPLPVGMCWKLHLLKIFHTHPLPYGCKTMNISSFHILHMKIFQATNLRMKLRSLHQMHKNISVQHACGKCCNK
jgi:hypothetical protein